MLLVSTTPTEVTAAVQVVALVTATTTTGVTVTTTRGVTVVTLVVGPAAPTVRPLRRLFGGKTKTNTYLVEHL